MAQTTGTTTITRKPKDGKQGTTFSIRKWKDIRIGDSFRIESAENGVLISDIVIYKDTETGVTSKWICKKAFTVTETTRDDTHLSLADANPTKSGTAYWKPFNNFHNVATDLVLADKAIIDNLLLNNMKAYPKDENGNWDTENPTVEIDGDTGKIRLQGDIYADNFYGGFKFEEEIDGEKVLQNGSYYLVSGASTYRLETPDAPKHVIICGAGSSTPTVITNRLLIPVAGGTGATITYTYRIKICGSSSVSLVYIWDIVSQSYCWHITNVFGTLLGEQNGTTFKILSDGAHL